MYYEVLRKWEKMRMLEHQILKSDIFIWPLVWVEVPKPKEKPTNDVVWNYTRAELRALKWTELRKLYSENIWSLNAWLSKVQILNALLNK